MSLFSKCSVWGQAMHVICQRHGLPTDRLVRFGDGTDPADGSSVVFAVGDQLVIKMFPPFRTNLFDADLSVAERVFGRLNVTTPEIHAHGMLDGWPYLLMSRVPGVYLSAIWDTLDDESQLLIVIELAEIVARLHAIPTDNLRLLENNWPQVIATRIKTCVERHREQGVPD